MLTKFSRFVLYVVFVLSLLVFNNASRSTSLLVGNWISPIVLAQVPGLFPVALRSEVVVGLGPSGVAFGDFSGEGLLDMAVVHTPGEDAWFFEGNCQDGFDLVAQLPTGGVNSSTIQAAEFDGDGLSDFITANWGNNTVTVFIRQGGTFVSQTLPVGITPVSLATGDLNGDGFEDIVTANGGSADTSVLFGDGTGVFTLSTIRSNIASGIVMADLNGDGVMDLAGTNRFSSKKGLFIHFGPFKQGRQAGFLVPAFSSNLATGGTSAQAIQAVDLDRDGDPDLAVVNFSSDKVDILLNDGKGQFDKPIPHRTQGRLPVTVRFGLFSDDPNLDMAVLTDGGGTLELFRGSGDGNFGASLLITEGLPTGSSDSSLTLADLDGD